MIHNTSKFKIIYHTAYSRHGKHKDVLQQDMVICTGLQNTFKTWPSKHLQVLKKNLGKTQRNRGNNLVTNFFH